MIQEVVVSEYLEEIERAKQPGYVSRYDDFDFEYTDAPRSKPARFDQAHGQPGDQRHARPAPKAENNVQNAGKPHFRQNEMTNSPAPMHAPPAPTDGFGAGIFPE